MAGKLLGTKGNDFSLLFIFSYYYIINYISVFLYCIYVYSYIILRFRNSCIFIFMSDV